jgi:hypothetical protein
MWEFEMLDFVIKLFAEDIIEGGVDIMIEFP